MAIEFTDVQGRVAGTNQLVIPMYTFSESQQLLIYSAPSTSPRKITPFLSQRPTEFRDWPAWHATCL